MVRYALYAHGGSGNHGCEAIVRSTSKILSLSNKDLLLTNSIQEDLRYNLDSLLHIEQSRNPFANSIIYRLKSKLTSNPDRVYFKEIYKLLPEKIKEVDIALSIGGDNYCYPGMSTEMSVLLEIIRKSKVSPVLFGCSVELKDYNNYLKTDFQYYRHIIARESYTYNLLAGSGLKQVVCLPDPAFQLNRIDLPLPEGFVEGNTVGINVSPMIIGYEKNKGMTLQNYIKLIDFIIENTDMQIALIPHVVWRHNDDRIPLRLLYEQFKDTGRVCLIEDHNAEELKGYIARCRFMIAARTHASIAAYSQCVPTLVVGYSVKARGIAKDLFGTEENYVLPVQSLVQESDLTQAFKYFLKNETSIKKHLLEFIPEYKNNVWKIKNIIEK